MKTLFLSILFLDFVFNSLAQNDDLKIISGYKIFTETVTVYEQFTVANAKRTRAGLLFSVVDEKPVLQNIAGVNVNCILIRFWNFNDNVTTRTEAANFSNRINVTNNGQYFWMTEQDFNSQTVKYYSKGFGGVDIGISLIPFRMRFANNTKNRAADIELTAIDALPTFAVKWRTSHSNTDNYFGIVGGIGITASKIDSSSFPLSSTVRDEYATPKNISMLTGTIGFMFEFNRGQIGLFFGKEFVGKDLKDWKYRNAPFISIGIGTPIFTVKNKVKSTEGKQAE